MLHALFETSVFVYACHALHILSLQKQIVVL